MIALSRKPGKLDTGLIGRGLEGFQNRAAVELQPCGVTELDAVLGGGFPRGSLVELCGPASSGRTSLAFSLLAQATERQEACAFVDVSDSLDPVSLSRLRVWNYRDCFGFDAEKPGSEDRISKRLHTLLLRKKK
jgi:RecA/RadA recombinase